MSPNEWFETTVASLDGEPEGRVPSFGSDDDWIVQQYRQVSLPQALERLPV